MTDTPNWRDPDLTIQERVALIMKQDPPRDLRETAIQIGMEVFLLQFGELCAARERAHAVQHRNARHAVSAHAEKVIDDYKKKLDAANALAAERLELLRYVVPTLSWCETDAEGFCTVHFDIVAGVLKRHVIPCPVQQIRDHVKNAESSHE